MRLDDLDKVIRLNKRLSERRADLANAKEHTVTGYSCMQVKLPGFIDVHLTSENSASRVQTLLVTILTEEVNAAADELRTLGVKVEL